MFLPSGEALCCHRGPLLACGERETGRRHVESGQILVLHPRERAGQVPIVAELYDDHPYKLRDHHEGGRPFRRFLVPPRQGPPRALDVRAPLPLHQTPQQQREPHHQP